MRISDWSSDVCSSDLQRPGQRAVPGHGRSGGGGGVQLAVHGHHRARQRQDGGGDPAGSRACHPVAVRRGGITVTEGGLSSSPSKGEQERARSVAPGQVPAARSSCLASPTGMPSRAIKNRKAACRVSGCHSEYYTVIAVSIIKKTTTIKLYN